MLHISIFEIRFAWPYIVVTAKWPNRSVDTIMESTVDPSYIRKSPSPHYLQAWYTVTWEEFESTYCFKIAIGDSKESSYHMQSHLNQTTKEMF